MGCQVLPWPSLPSHIGLAVRRTNSPSYRVQLPTKMCQFRVCIALKCVRQANAKMNMRFSLLFDLHFVTIRTQTRLSVVYPSFVRRVRLGRVGVPVVEDFLVCVYAVFLFLFAPLFAFKVKAC